MPKEMKRKFTLTHKLYSAAEKETCYRFTLANGSTAEDTYCLIEDENEWSYVVDSTGEAVGGAIGDYIHELLSNMITQADRDREPFQVTSEHIDEYNQSILKEIGDIVKRKAA